MIYCSLKNPTEALVQDLVSNPFLRNGLEILEVENSKGTKPKLLLNALNKIIYESDDSTDDSSDNIEMEENTTWEEKLSAAHHDDMYQQYKFIENWEVDADFNYKNQFNENYDQWADRLYQEYIRKQKSASKIKSKTSTKKDIKKDSEEIPRKTLKLKLKPDAEMVPQLNYDEVKKLLCKTCKNPITAKSLKFTVHSSPDSIINAILKDKIDLKNSLREAIRIWHPDKFSQMYDQRILASDASAVHEIVLNVTSALLKYGK